MSRVRESPNSPQWCVWTDPDGLIWEFRYIVTQFEHEGPEYMEYRLLGDDEWKRDPDQDDIPESVMKFFFG